MEMVNDATGVRYPGATNGEGIYQIPNLPPGPYRLQVSRPGFKTLIKPDIVLRTEDALAINFTLPVGAALETVTVQGGASVLETESAAVSTVIDRQFVENLPLNGRSFNTLLQLTPGVVIAHQRRQALRRTAPGQFSIAGQRTDANSFTVDGVSANFGVADQWSLFRRVRNRIGSGIQRAGWHEQPGFGRSPAGISHRDIVFRARIRKDTRRPGDADDAFRHQ